MNKKIVVLLIITIILTANLFILNAQEKEKGKLADFEEEVEKESNSDNNDDGDRDYSYVDDDDYDESGCFLSPVIWQAIFKGVANLLFVSKAEIKSGYTKVGYSDYPYCTNSDGIYDQHSLKKYSIYSSMSYFRESNTLNALNFNARLSPLPAISLELNYSDFTEKLKTRYDHLRIYDIFINYNRLKFDNFALWWGLGYKGIMGDESHGSIALNIGTNIFLPGIPLSLAFNYNIGFFESTNVYDFSPKIRFHKDRFELSIGYRRFSAGNVSINGLTLGFGFYL
jgi:hypothetical protein